MAQHFPEIFKTPNVKIDARSTVVVRCILSMIAECEELAAANPTAQIHNDVSESLQYYLNQPWEGTVKAEGKKGDKEETEYKQKYTHLGYRLKYYAGGDIGNEHPVCPGY